MEWRLERLLGQVRRAGTTPLSAHRSAPALLRKKWNVRGVKGLRMIHVLCPFWRAWHKQLKDRTLISSIPYPDNNHGFVPGRRRESALLIQMVLAARLRKRGMSFVTTLHDGTNAFASTRHEVLSELADHGMAEAERHFFHTRRVNAQIWIPVQGDTLVAVPGCGALMGDGDAPRDFARAYQPGIDEWDALLAQKAGARATRGIGAANRRGE